MPEFKCGKCASRSGGNESTGSKTSTKPAGDRIPNGIKFLFGGFAGMGATTIIQPLDMVKTRMQVSGGKKTSLGVAKEIVNKEGLFALYNGLSAGLLRQATYSTTRLGIYTTLFEHLSGPNGQPPGFITKATIAMVSGIIGAFVGTPADVALIRMTSDGRLPPAERRNYKNVFNALMRIKKEEGVAALWRGAVPTMGRAMVVNAALLSSYSQAKEALLSTGHFREGIFLHFCCSMISGAVTTVVSLPVDLVKTRIQNMKTINGKPEYTGQMDVVRKLVKKEGVLALWKGITPYFARIAPHAVFTFIFLEQLNGWYKRSVLGVKDAKGGGL